MSKTIINFWLDLLLMILFLVIVWVSTVLHLIFPAGTSAKGWMIWGWNYNEWRGFQYATLAIFTLGVLVQCNVALELGLWCGLDKNTPLKNQTRLRHANNLRRDSTHRVTGHSRHRRRRRTVFYYEALLRVCQSIIYSGGK